MKQVFRLLVDLQQTDTELKALNDKHAAVPGRIAELRRSAEELKAGFEATRQSIVEHRKQYKLAEVDLRSAEEKAGTYSVQLYAAKTNEQYKAFLKEIEAQKRLASQVEDRMLSLMEKLEALESGVKATEKQTAEVDVDVARKVALLETEQQELGAGIAGREARRAEMVAAMPADVLKRYERVRANKGGIAVASTRGERCNGCLSPVPAQRLIEVETGERLFTCETCGRILVPPE